MAYQPNSNKYTSTDFYDKDESWYYRDHYAEMFGEKKDGWYYKQQSQEQQIEAPLAENDKEPLIPGRKIHPSTDSHSKTYGTIETISERKNEGDSVSQKLLALAEEEYLEEQVLFRNDTESNQIQVGLQKTESTLESISQLRQRLVSEWNLPCFFLKDSSGNELDLENAFRPKPAVVTFIIRYFMLALSTGVFLFDLVIDRGKDTDVAGLEEIDANEIGGGYISYICILSNCTTILSITYFLCSLVSTFIKIKPQLSYINAPQSSICWTWALFSVAAPAEIVSSFLYWTIDYDGDPLYARGGIIALIKHGIIGLLVLVDGFLIGRVPLRFKQINFVVIYFSFFVLSACTDHILNKPKNYESETEDTTPVQNNLMYPLVKIDHSESNLWLGLSSSLLLAPTAFLLCWAISPRNSRSKNSSRRAKVFISVMLTLLSGLILMLWLLELSSKAEFSIIYTSN